MNQSNRICTISGAVIAFLSFISSFTTCLYANDVDTTKAKLVGKNFITPKIREASKLKSTAVLNVQMKLAFTKYANGKPIYYIYNFVGRSGFMIISADDEVQPVLGFSFETSFSISDTKPDAFQSMLTGFSEQISYHRKNISRSNPAVKQLWNMYSSGGSNLKSTPVSLEMTTTSLPASVAPLLSTKWNQGCGWNALCPTDAAGQCGRTWAGCVAVSEAQVMKFWNYPVNGSGSNSYNHYKYGVQSADFGTATYDWASMPNTSSNAEVAKLLYHVGVSVNMDYGTSGSGAYMQSTVGSLKNNFKYSPNLTSASKGSYSDANWENLIKRELSEGRPLPYSGGTHAFILDGYQSGNYFHVNWGWGGSYDGYYYLNNLKPGSSDFTSSNCAIIGVMPKALYTGVDMASIKTLSCGVVLYDSTSNGENRINSYNLGYSQTTGKEKIYSITTSLNGRLKGKITGLGSKKFNLFLLKYPSKDSALAYGDSSVYIDKAKPGTYYIAVDGLYGDEGKYAIKVNCPTNDPDLTLYQPEITPYYIQPYHTNVSLKCWIKNIGHATASTNKLKFYYSEDKVLNAGDTPIDSVTVASLNAGDSVKISKMVNMPAVTNGTRYVLFVADSNNQIIETDEEDNVASSMFQGVPAGIMNCSGAVPLKSKIWYNGNTSSKGDSIINTYLFMKEMTGKEVIHSFTAPYNGIATINFSEKVMGDLTCLLLTGCNENLMDRTIRIYNKNDTMISLTYVVKKNTTYYLVVDGENRLAGPYSLMVNLPDSCPAPTVTTSSDTNRCTGSGSAYLNAAYGYSSYQWFKNGFPILNASMSGYSATEDGSYDVQVVENGCTANSNKITIRYSPAPTSPNITSVGDTTFCKDGNVALNLVSPGAYTYQWTKNNVKIKSATAASYNATQTGLYRAEVTNQSCTLKSNSVTVTAKNIAADLGDTLKVSSSGLVTYYPFNGSNDYMDASGNSNYNSGSGTFLTYDKQGLYNLACYFDGLKSYMTTSNKFNHPDTFTLSLWFKTNTNKGGKLIGLGNQQYNGLSTTFDRHIYMDNAGKLYFGVGTTTKTTVSSSLTYNDDKWHLVTATLSSGGMKLYVDTLLVDSKSTPIAGGAYLGYWRLGCDNVNGWPNKPDSAHFKGTIDEVRIYKRELISSEVGLLYSARILSVKATPEAICQAKGKSKITIRNSELGITYQLRKNSDNSNMGTAITGTGETIQMETDSISTTTSFNVLTKNLTTGCEHQLDTIITIPVNSVLTPAVSITSSALNDSICAGQSVTFTAHPVNGGTPNYQWKLNGSNLAGNAATFISSALNDKDSVRVIMTSTISCVTTPVISSGKIKMGVSPMVTPSVSLSSNAAGNAICKGSTLSVNASTTYCGTSASYDWQLNKAMVGGSTPNFSSGSLVNGDKICVTVTSAGKCITSNKAYSDTITVKVTEVSKPAIILKSSDTLQATVSAETYEWYRNSDLLPASDRVLKLLSSGNYKVVAVQNFCKSEISEAYVYTGTGVERSKGVEMVLFPNPSEGLLQLKLSGVEEDLTMEIMNTEGKVILQDQITEKGVVLKPIDLSGSQKGLYLLRLKGTRWVRIMKITVK